MTEDSKEVEKILTHFPYEMIDDLFKTVIRGRKKAYQITLNERIIIVKRDLLKRSLQSLINHRYDPL
jgi:hypothetical protein